MIRAHAVTPIAIVIWAAGAATPCAAHGLGGHGGGAGHVVAARGGPGFRGGCGPYYGRGYYGYPYGFGYGFGLGLGLGYGYGWGYPYGYGYNYYQNYYGWGYPAGPYVPGYSYPANGAPAPGACPPGGYAPPPAAETGGTVGAPPARSDVILNVDVPSSAEIWVNGIKTSQTGTHREFVSGGMDPRRSYTFEVKARWNAFDGLPIELVRRVSVHSGERLTVDFTHSPSAESNLIPASATAPNTHP